MGKLRLEVSETPLAGDHRRLTAALQRGRLKPERSRADKLRGKYTPDAVVVATQVWRQRMLHEHNSSAVFARLLPQLIEAEAPMDVKTAVVRAAFDELRHASLCGQVVELLGGEASVEGDLKTQPLPDHADGSAKERALRNMLFVGCLSETGALAMLTEERASTKEPFIVRVLTQLGADEVLHAKLGWSYLGLVWPRLDDAAKKRTSRYLRVALAAIERDFMRAMPTHGSTGRMSKQLAALGLLPAKQGRELFYETLETVTLPRLQSLGMDAFDAWKERSLGR